MGVSLFIGLTLSKSLNVILFYTCDVQSAHYPNESLQVISIFWLQSTFTNTTEE